MKKLLIIIFILLLLIFVSCNTQNNETNDKEVVNTEVIYQISPRALAALNGEKEYFNSFNEFEVFYTNNIKNEAKKYTYVDNQLEDGQYIYTQEFSISYPSEDSTYNDICLVRGYYYYDVELGNYVPEGDKDTGLVFSMIATFISYEYSGILSSHFIFMYHNINHPKFNYNKEIAVYSGTTLIMSVLYVDLINIPKEYLENYIISGLIEI